MDQIKPQMRIHSFRASARALEHAVVTQIRIHCRD